MREASSDHTNLRSDGTQDRSVTTQEHLVAKRAPEKTVGVELRNFRDIRDRAVDTVIARMLDKLRTSEGISTNPQDLAKEAVEVLKRIDSELPAQHSLKWIPLRIAENYFTPQERGAFFIRTLIDEGGRMLETKRLPGFDASRYPVMAETIKGSLGLLFDLGKTADSSKLAEYRRMVCVSREVQAVFEQVPGLEGFIFDTLPKLARTTDKAVLMASIDRFFSESRVDILSVLDTKSDEGARVDSMLRVTGNMARLSQAALNEKNASEFLNGVTKFPQIREHPVIRELLPLLEHPNITPADRHELVRFALSGVELFSNQKVSEKEADQYVNRLVAFLNGISQKLPPELVARTVAKLVGSGTQGGSIDTLYESKGGLEIAKNLWNLVRQGDSYDSKAMLAFADRIRLALRDLIAGKIGSWEDFFRFLFENKVLDTTISATKGRLVEHIRQFVNLNFQSISHVFRKKILELEQQKSSARPIAQIDETIQARKESSNTVEAFSGYLFDGAVRTFFGPDRPKRITKETLASLVADSARTYLSSLKEDSLVVGKIRIPKEAAIRLVSSPQFKPLVTEWLGNLLSASEGMGPREAFSRMVEEFLKNPLDNGVVKTGIRSGAVDLLYGSDSRTVAEIVSKNPDLFWASFSKLIRSGTVGTSDIADLFGAVQRNIPKEFVQRAFENYSKRSTELGAKNGVESSMNVGAESSKKGEGEFSTKDFLVQALQDLPNDRFEWFVRDFSKLPVTARVVGMDSASLDRMGQLVSIVGKERIAWLMGNPDTLRRLEALKNGPRNPGEVIKHLEEVLVEVTYSLSDDEFKKAIGVLRQDQKIGKFLAMPVLGKTVEDFLPALRHSIRKEELRSFLILNAEAIDRYISWGSDTEAVRIGLEFAKIVDLQGSPLSDELRRWASSEVIFGLEHAQEIRTAIRRLQWERPDVFERIIALWTRFRTEGLDPAQAEIFASDIFDALSVLMSELADWKIPEAGTDNPEIRTAFVKNNLWFIVSQAIPYLFGRTKETILTRYFQDSENKSGFSATVIPLLRKGA